MARHERLAVALRNGWSVRWRQNDAVRFTDAGHLRLSPCGRTFAVRLFFQWRTERKEPRPHLLRSQGDSRWRDDGRKIGQSPGWCLPSRHDGFERQFAHFRPFGAAFVSAPRRFVAGQEQNQRLEKHGDFGSTESPLRSRLVPRFIVQRNRLHRRRTSSRYFIWTSIW